MTYHLALPAIGIVLGLLFFPITTIQAQVTPRLSVTPPKIDLSIKPGQIFQALIRLGNQSTEAIPIKAVVMDFAPRDNRGGVEIGKTVANRSATAWIQIPNPDTVLAPNETKDLTVNINPPETTIAGSYFAALIFQPQLPSNYFQPNAQTRIIPWIGVLILLQVGDRPKLDERSLTVKNFRIPRLRFGQDVPAQLEIVNHTDFHLSPDTEFTLQTTRGTVVTRLLKEDITIMPGRSRLVEVDLAPANLLGVYVGAAKIRLPNYEQTVFSHPLAALSFSWLAILIGALSLISWGWKKRDRLTKALRALRSP